MHYVIQPSQRIMRAVSCCPKITAEGAEAQRCEGLGWIPALSAPRTPGVIPPLSALWLWSAHCPVHLVAPCSASSVAPTDSRIKSSFTLVFKARLSPNPMQPAHCEPLLLCPCHSIAKPLPRSSASLDSPLFPPTAPNPIPLEKDRQEGH